MNTPTPETDASESRIFSIVKSLSDTDEIPAILHAIHLELDDARKLERERDEARKEMIELKCELALSSKHDDERPIATIRGLVSQLIAIEHERDQLRKVADELALRQQVWMKTFPSESWEEDYTALSAYNELPHVKKPLT